MEGCSKTSAGAAASDLPDDLLVEILSRVPAKSVCRFKCVSKAWRDLITDPHHRKKLRHPMQGLYRNELATRSFSFVDLKVGSVPLHIDHCFSFMTEMAGTDTFLLDSCNGPLLFGQRQKQPHRLHGYIVCNPTTRQWSAIPDCGSPAVYGRTFLAFDPAVSSHFHLVLFQMVDYAKNIMLLHVYSSETRIWSQNQIYEHKEQGQLEGWLHQFELDDVDHCTYVNGFLHFIVYGSEQHILAVDIQGKARKIITMPSMADGTFYLGQSQGHLHCVTREFENKKVSTWVLQDYDTQEWVLKTIVNFLDVFGRREQITAFHVVDIHQDCNVVFFLHHRRCELIAYNMDSKEASVVATFEKPILRSEFARYIPYFSESPSLTNKY